MYPIQLFSRPRYVLLLTPSRARLLTPAVSLLNSPFRTISDFSRQPTGCLRFPRSHQNRAFQISMTTSNGKRDKASIPTLHSMFI
jgi:hypothetical protein